MENALHGVITDRNPVEQDQSYDPAKTLLVTSLLLRPQLQQQHSAGVPTEETNTDHSRDELIINK